MQLHRIALLCPVLFACGGEAPSVELQGEPDPVTTPAPDLPPDHARESDTLFLSRYQPRQGLVGTKVQILGSFSDDRSETIVTIGGARAAILDDDYILTVEVPPDAQTGPLCVAEGDRSVCGEAFTVLAGPVLYSISPDTLLVGSRDTTIEMHGDGFTEGMEMWFYRTGIQLTVHSAQHLSAVIPAYDLTRAGTHDLSLYKREAPGAGTTNPVTLTVANPGPVIDRLEPATIPVGMSSQLTIVGRGLVNGSVVIVDGAVELPAALVSEGSLVIATPSGLRPVEHTIHVMNPRPGGGVSAPVTLTVE